MLEPSWIRASSIFDLILGSLLLGCGPAPEAGDPVCGDGVAEGTEACDGDDLAGTSCEALGLSGDGAACIALAVLTTA